MPSGPGLAWPGWPDWPDPSSERIDETTHSRQVAAEMQALPLARRRRLRLARRNESRPNVLAGGHETGAHAEIWRTLQAVVVAVRRPQQQPASHL